MSLFSHFIQLYLSSSTSENINILLHRSTLPALPSYDSLSVFSQLFAKFFFDKIHKLHTTDTSLLIYRRPSSASPHSPSPFAPPKFSSFTRVTTDEVSKLSQSPGTNYDLDPIPTSLLKQCSHILPHTITNIINLDLYCIFPDRFKSCFIHPHLNKSNLYKNDLDNYCRPISHLSILSKLLLKE